MVPREPPAWAHVADVVGADPAVDLKLESTTQLDRSFKGFPSPSSIFPLAGNEPGDSYKGNHKG